jgi:hypothetical protein
MASTMTFPMERRRHTRTQLQMTLRSIRLDPECGDVVDCLHMQNISRSGLGAIVDRPFYPGQRVVLFLPVQGQGRKNVYARVVRCSQVRHAYEVGLEFETMSVGSWCGAPTEAVAAA